MFGKGVYLADMSTKSANYCHSELSDDTALLLLCEVELGKPMHELEHANYNAETDAKNNGRISVLGKGSTGPPIWKDAGCVHPDLKGVLMVSSRCWVLLFLTDADDQPDMRRLPTTTGVIADLAYNEYIVYDVAQIRLRYLLRVSIDYLD